MSNDLRQSLENIFMVVRNVVIILVLPMAFCNVLVLTQKSMHHSTSSYLIGLSIAEILYILIDVGARIIPSVVPNPRTNFYYLTYSIYMTSYASIVVKRASNVVVCLLSAERLYAVMRPLHVKELFLSSKSTVVWLAVYCMTAILHIFLLTRYSVVQAKDASGDVTYVVMPLRLYVQHKVFNDGLALAAPILWTYVSLMVLLALNALTTWALHRHGVAARDLRSAAGDEVLRRRERNLTRTFLIMTVSYVVVSLPYAFHSMMTMAFPSYDSKGTYSNLYALVRSATFTLSLLTCAIDFVCFLVMSSGYKKACGDLFYSVCRIFC